MAVHGIKNKNLRIGLNIFWMKLLRLKKPLRKRIMMISQVAKEHGLFTVDEVIREVADKIRRRHPHVFGNERVRDAQEALRLFYEVKEKEKKSKK